ncbi:hypothetical protein [Streptomyces sp. NPDC048248]|uniref:hypothetical protein n=1 Tax=Streptomyces sp. NPDC048248 TaxID=3365523 RepID=UPI0037241B8A
MTRYLTDAEWLLEDLTRGRRWIGNPMDKAAYRALATLKAIGASRADDAPIYIT